jgi:hypothetical protein
MATRANARRMKTLKDPAVERLDKAFRDSLTKVEDLAKKRILQARDPLRTGLTLAREIRRLADSIDAEVIAQGIDETEAGIFRGEAAS